MKHYALKQLPWVKMRGFTLLELLVTIAVIGILAALLLPALSRSKARALTTVCAGNLRQLMLSWTLYAQDNHGRIASSYYFHNGNINSNAWVRGSMDDDTAMYPPVTSGVLDSTNLLGITLGALFPYNHSSPIYHCPADRSETDGIPRVRSYSMNGWMNGTYTGGQSNFIVFRRESDIVVPSPSGAWVFIDEHERSINDGWFAMDMVGDEGLLDAPATRHNYSYTLGFADGHTEIWKLTDPRTRHWTLLPILNNPLNEDWQRLQRATTSHRQ